jgi:hypothetical protein
MTQIFLSVAAIFTNKTYFRNFTLALRRTSKLCKAALAEGTSGNKLDSYASCNLVRRRSYSI